jgi:hypothetical protein
MATLQRRVQILFDPTQYAALEAEAAATHQSVAAVVRDAVNDRLRRTRRSKQAALKSLFLSADADPVAAPEDWDAFKDELEAEALRDRP